jgi:hypothetical protein
MFLQPWDMPSPIGNMLCASMELLQLEVGCSGCPLNKPFHPMGQLAMHCWLKSFWEVVGRFRLQLVVDYPEIPYPRLNDQLIMQLAICLGFSGEELDSINRCCLVCCCTFLSDLASANGKFLDPTRGLQGVNYLPELDILFSTGTSVRWRLGSVESVLGSILHDRRHTAGCTQQMDAQIPPSMGEAL